MVLVESGSGQIFGLTAVRMLADIANVVNSGGIASGIIDGLSGECRFILLSPVILGFCEPDKLINRDVLA